MNAVLGHVGVLLSLCAAAVGAVVCVAGIRRKRSDWLRSAGIYAGLLLLGAVLATIAMERALVTHDFSIAYVAANSSRQTPLLYTITGMWSALAGSILLWGLILSGYIACGAVRFRKMAGDPLVGWAMLVLFVVAIFFFALMAGPLGSVPDGHRDHPLGRPRPERAPAGQPARGIPPAAALPRVRRFHGPVLRSRSHPSSPDGSAKAGR